MRGPLGPSNVEWTRRLVPFSVFCWLLGFVALGGAAFEIFLAANAGPSGAGLVGAGFGVGMVVLAVVLWDTVPPVYEYHAKVIA